MGLRISLLSRRNETNIGVDILRTISLNPASVTDRSGSCCEVSGAGTKGNMGQCSRGV
jgi:hypothetical protein